MCKSNYITKHYAILTYGLCILFVVALGISTWITIKTEIDKLSYGIVILLFADVTLAVMSIVSMVAMFHEMSRLHARKIPTDVIDRVNEIAKQLEQLSEGFNEEKEHFEKITSVSKCCTQLKERLDVIGSKLDGVSSHAEKSGKKKIKDIVKSFVNKFKKLFSSMKKVTSEIPISTDTPAETREDKK